MTEDGTFHFRYRGDRRLAAVFTVLCLCLIAAAFLLDGGPWGDLAGATAILALLFGLEIDIEGRPRDRRDTRNERASGEETP